MTPKIKFGIAGIIIAIIIILSFNVNSGNQLPHNVDSSGDVLRIGYFPNINHAQAVIGLGNGDFQKELGDVKVETQVFNAG
ncbi:MAG: sulfate ABC transporter substrate-binding protein, partial [Thaumarchaeota archaeon]